jgi:hypothetical protein
MALVAEEGKEAELWGTISFLEGDESDYRAVRIKSF